LLWIILGLGWLFILCAAVCLFRIAGYADKKMRRIVQQRPTTRHSEDQAA
jgi:hypothetical protein